MNRIAQHLVLFLLGGALLRISAFSTMYVNYVKEGFRPYLIAAGLAIVVVAVVGAVQDLRRTGHGHHHGPVVAWLLCLPALVVAVISPPALGSFAASRSEDEVQVVPAGVAPTYAPVKVTGAKPVTMNIGEYMSRAWDRGGKTLAGKTLRLTGFVTPSKKGDRWYVTRMHINCCAADAIANKVAVLGVAQPPADSWVEVTGTWIKTKAYRTPEMTGISLRPVEKPEQPYQ